MIKLCECGCGQAAPVVRQTYHNRGRMKGEPGRFIYHHNNRKHGMSATPEYNAYKAALYRCVNPKHSEWKDYGGRGIEFRFTSFEQFFAELGLRPSPQHSLDRINNDGHYEPGNVRWATAKEQRFNKRKIKALQSFSDEEFIKEGQRRGLIH